MTRLLFIVSAIYLAAIGLSLLIVPVQFGVNAVPEDASSELISLLRLLGGPFLGIATLNWLSRDAQPSAARDTVVLANLVGFGVVAANDVAGVLTGNARDLAAVFLVVHVSFAIAFLIAWSDRSRRSTDGATAG